MDSFLPDILTASDFPYLRFFVRVFLVPVFVIVFLKVFLFAAFRLLYSRISVFEFFF